MIKEYFWLFAMITAIVIAVIIGLAAIKMVQAAEVKHAINNTDDSKNYIVVTNSDVGEILLAKDSVQAMKKDNSFYLTVSVEERFTDKEFLTALRSGENLADAASQLSLYVFSNDGTFYWIPNRYLVDTQGRICADLGSVEAQAVNKDAILLKIYTAALKVMEAKK